MANEIYITSGGLDKAIIELRDKADNFNTQFTQLENSINRLTRVGFKGDAAQKFLATFNGEPKDILHKLLMEARNAVEYMEMQKVRYDKFEDTAQGIATRK